jgi:hypothetical protein
LCEKVTSGYLDIAAVIQSAGIVPDNGGEAAGNADRGRMFFALGEHRPGEY